jgi:putative addiction module killer protein
MRYQLVKTLEYDEWVEGETQKAKAQIADRLERIESEGHFGLNRHLEGFVWELKWKSGRRVYYALIPPDNVIILLGGNKNGQDKDIKEAKKIFKSYIE